MFRWIRSKLGRSGAAGTLAPSALTIEDRLLSELITQNAWLRDRVDACHRVMVAGSWRNAFEENDAVRRHEMGLAQIKANMQADTTRAAVDGRYTDAGTILQQ